MRVIANLTARPAARRSLLVEDNDALRQNIKEPLEIEGWCRRERAGKPLTATYTF